MKLEITYVEFVKFGILSIMIPSIGYIVCVLCAFLYIATIACIIEHIVKRQKIKEHFLSMYMYCLIGASPGMLISAIGAEFGRYIFWPFIFERLNQL